MLKGNLVERYLNEKKIPYLTIAEEKQLALRASNGDQKARQILIERNLKTINEIAKQYAGNGISEEDLFQVGCIRLIRFIDESNLASYRRVSDRAKQTVEDHIQRLLLQKQHGNRLPITFIDKIEQYNKAEQALTEQLGRAPSVPEIVEETGFPLDIVTNIYNFYNNTISIDTLVDDVDITEIPFEEKIIMQADLNKLLYKLNLSQRQILILKLKYGFDNNNITTTYHKIAQIYGCCAQNIQQRERTLLKNIRQSSYIGLLEGYASNQNDVMQNFFYKKEYVSRILELLKESIVVNNLTSKKFDIKEKCKPIKKPVRVKTKESNVNSIEKEEYLEINNTARSEEEINIQKVVLSKYPDILNMDMHTCISIIKSDKILESLLEKTINDNIESIKANNFDLLTNDNSIIKLIETYCLFNNISIPFQQTNGLDFYKKFERIINREYGNRKEINTYLDMINQPLLGEYKEQELLFQTFVNNKEAENMLIIHNFKIVAGIAMQYLDKDIHLKDLIKEGNVYLKYAIDTYDLTDGYSFKNYASYVIREGMRMISKEKAQTEPTNDKITNRDFIKNKDTNYEKQRNEKINEIIDGLDGIDKEIATLYFNPKNKKAVTEIARELDMNISSARETIADIRKLFAATMNETLDINTNTNEKDDIQKIKVLKK